MDFEKFISSNNKKTLKVIIDTRSRNSICDCTAFLISCTDEVTWTRVFFLRFVPQFTVKMLSPKSTVLVINAKKMAFNNEKTMDHVHPSVFYSSASKMHIKNVLPMRRHRALAISSLRFAWARYFCTYKWFFMWFRSIFRVYAFHPTGCLSSFRLASNDFFLLSLFPLWLHIYLFICLLILCNSRAMLCQSFSSFALISSSIVLLQIELSFRYLLVKISVVTWEPITLCAAALYRFHSPKCLLWYWAAFFACCIIIRLKSIRYFVAFIVQLFHRLEPKWNDTKISTTC